MSADKTNLPRMARIDTNGIKIGIADFIRIHSCHSWLPLFLFLAFLRDESKCSEDECRGGVKEDARNDRGGKVVGDVLAQVREMVCDALLGPDSQAPAC